MQLIASGSSTETSCSTCGSPLQKSHSTCKSPQPRRRSTSKSPQPRRRSTSQSPQPRRRSTSKSPQPRRRSTSKSPQPRRRSTSKSPQPRSRSTSKSPQPRSRSTSKSQQPRRRSTSKSPQPRRRSTSKSPRRRSRSTSCPPLRRNHIRGKTPLRRSRSRSSSRHRRSCSRSPWRRSRSRSWSYHRSCSISPWRWSRSRSRSCYRRSCSISPWRRSRSRSTSYRRSCSISPWRRSRSRSTSCYRRSCSISPWRRSRSRSTSCYRRSCSRSPWRLSRSRSRSFHRSCSRSPWRRSRSRSRSFHKSCSTSPRRRSRSRSRSCSYSPSRRSRSRSRSPEQQRTRSCSTSRPQNRRSVSRSRSRSRCPSPYYSSRSRSRSPYAWSRSRSRSPNYSSPSRSRSPYAWSPSPNYSNRSRSLSYSGYSSGSFGDLSSRSVSRSCSRSRSPQIMRSFSRSRSRSFSRSRSRSRSRGRKRRRRRSFSRSRSRSRSPARRRRRSRSFSRSRSRSRSPARRRRRSRSFSRSRSRSRSPARRRINRRGRRINRRRKIQKKNKAQQEHEKDSGKPVDIDENVTEFFFANASVDEHFKAQNQNRSKYISGFTLLHQKGVELHQRVRVRALAASWARNDFKLSTDFLCDRDRYGVVEILKALQILDSGRCIRQKEKQLKRLQVTPGKVSRCTIKNLKNKINNLRHLQPKHGSANGPVCKNVRKWTKTLRKQELELYALHLPKKPWKKLADICHLNPVDDFPSVPWFLPYCFDQPAPSGTVVHVCKDLNRKNINEKLKICDIPYTHCRKFRKYLNVESKIKIATSEPQLDTVLWYYEDLECRQVDEVIMQRLDTGDTSNLPIGKLMDRLLTLKHLARGFRSGKRTIEKYKIPFMKTLINLADSKLQNIKLKLDSPVVVLGDRSASMDIAVRTSSVISGILCSICSADLVVFNNRCQRPTSVPGNVDEALKLAMKTRAHGGTNPSAALKPFYKRKKIVKTFIIVTDEEENIGNFADLFEKYHAEVYPAKLVFVSFLAQHQRGEMCTRLMEKGFNPLQFVLNSDRPDLTKLEKLFGILASDSTSFTEELSNFQNETSGNICSSDT
ncbi:serine/arginine repetitive matrix protein 2-like [Ylistrum balloti]|uniref:serine/arginine repetitive matrix protein 2-like n=1 Tax=Ylistrum balloti TaxID=509963 RepID=UPI002905A305|nr:serine/arginine repetitive matrix protein 2-like [Ylistrum balloti]